MSNKKPLLQTILVLILLGMGVSSYSLWHHIAINSNSLSSSSFCNVSSYINCDAVALSKWSTFFGYPVAALALVFYAALFSTTLALYFLPKEESDRRNPLRGHLFALTSIGLVPTFLLAGVSVFGLSLLCLMCLTSYLINLGLWILSLRLNKGNSIPFVQSILPPKSSWPVYFSMCAVFALSPVVMKGLVGARSIDSSLLKTILYKHFTETPKSIVNEGAPSLGNKDAKIVIVEYSDFQCPYCARAATVIPQIVLAHSKNVRLVSKQYPLDPNCNSGITGRGHPHSCGAAKAAYCVFKTKGNDAYYSIEKKLFANQSSLNTNNIREYALQEGLTEAELDSCYNDPATHSAIVTQVEEGVAVGVEGTPSIFINGRKLENGASAEVLKAALDKYLNSTL